MANLRANKIVGIGSTDAGVVFDGDVKINSQGVMYFPKGDTSQRGRGRGVFGGGIHSPNPSTTAMQYIQIQSTSNAVDFGSLTAARSDISGSGNGTRGVLSGGYNPAASDVIDYVTIATTGNATDFGDLISIRTGTSALGNSIRGTWFGGYSPTWVNIIDYVTIATTANASDFGDGVNTVRNAGPISDSHGGLS